MIRHLLALLVAAALAVTPAVAGKYNSKLSIGDAAPAWSGLPGVDGKTHALADLKTRDVVVVAFISNDCEVSKVYEDRLIAFNKQFGGPDSNVGFIAISCSNLEEDRLPRMKERAQQKGFNFDYLCDESQNIGRAYGASVTPEFFVLDRHRKVVYMGAMDNSNRTERVKQKYLEAAVRATLKGEKPALAETAPRGCSLEYDR